MDMDFDSGLIFDDLFSTDEKTDKTDKSNNNYIENDLNITQKSICLKTVNKYLYRRFSGEKRLEEIAEWEFEKGCAYHIISMGDIDGLSFLKFLIRQQPLEYLALSTWGMYMQDIASIKEWIDLGRIRNFDIYVGEIFRNHKKNFDEIFLL